LVAYAELYQDFRAAGYALAAVSVDTPRRSAALRTRLNLPYPLLCDPQKNAIKEWGLFNRFEHGGIAKPATFVLDPVGTITWANPTSHRESTARRAQPAGLLQFLRGGNAAPKPRGIWPGFRDLIRAIRH